MTALWPERAAATPPCACLCQFRVFLYLDAPSLVIYEVPVEDIEFVHCQDVNIPFHELHIEEVPADIEVHAARISTAARAVKRERGYILQSI